MSRHIKSRKRRAEIVERRRLLDAVLSIYSGHAFENPIAMVNVQHEGRRLGSYHGTPGRYLCWDGNKTYIGWRARQRDVLIAIVNAELRRRDG